MKKVHKRGDTYVTQQKFHLEGLFGIKVTMMGTELVLLEAGEEIEIRNCFNEDVGCAFFFFWVKMYFPPNYFNLNIFFFIFLLSNNSYYFSLFFIYFFPSHISTSSPLFLLLLPNTLLVICLYVGIC